jgi:ABC-type sugar transport system substrate-binding protein
VQADVPSLGAVRAIVAAGRGGDIVLASFDGTPETLDCLRKGEILVSGMQQPGLMGRRAAEALMAHLQGKKVDRQIFVPILLVTAQSLDEQLPIIRENVFANEAR